MKLSNKTLKSLGVSVSEGFAASQTMLESALQWAEEGWYVFPLRPGSKFPLIKRAHEKGDKCRGECGRDGHGAYDGTRNPEKIRRWWTQNPNAGIGANLGEDRIAFDVDVNHGGTFLRSFPETRHHYSGRGNGNAHVIYQFEPGSLASTIRNSVGNKGFITGIDIRITKGAYIVLPPTTHEETGKPYTSDGNPIATLTDADLQSIYDEAGVLLPAVSRGAKKGLSLVGGGGGSRSTLSALLADVPERGTGQANDWLTKVAGHYAKQYRDKRDLYDHHMMEANAKLSPPLDEGEYSKTIESIWEAEVAQHPERQANEDNGWLVGNKRRIAVQVMRNIDGAAEFSLEPWGDFDVEALGVAVDDNDNRMYWVRIFWNDRTIESTIESSLFGDDRALKKWLASKGPTVISPRTAYPDAPVGTRLLRYIQNQKPPVVNVVDTLGWQQDIEKFITHDGAITHEGEISKEDAGVVASHHLIERDVAPYNYGFKGDWAEAQRVLREVLTFQDETVTSVFGAWWAATLLRPQIKAITSLFPIFGVEATSESGKTNGFFDMMVALNGNTRGQVAPTRPVLRDLASSNKNGIVWADDLDDLSAYGEILRASTSNGTASKMSIDNSGIKNTEIVSSILLTGEALGMSSQKALMDRAVLLNVPSPKDRMSLSDPSRAQWHDIKDLQQQYPKTFGGLTALAGWYVQAALMVEDEAMAAYRRAQAMAKAGRHGEKIAVLLAGAMLLDALLDHDGAWEGAGEHHRRVLAWATGVAATVKDKDNALTMTVLPRLLSLYGQDKFPPMEHTMGKFQNIDTPVFIQKNSEAIGMPDEPNREIWYNVNLVSIAWERDRNGRVAARTESKEALQQQSNALPKDSKPKTFRLRDAEGMKTSRTVQYRRLNDDYARLVFERMR